MSSSASPLFFRLICLYPWFHRVKLQFQRRNAKFPREESFWKTYMFDKSAVAVMSLATRSVISDASYFSYLGSNNSMIIWVHTRGPRTTLRGERAGANAIFRSY